MRRGDVLALLACGALSAGVAAAHGVHALRGTVRVASGRLLVEIEPLPHPPAESPCLRWLDELHVRAPSGTRLAGTRGTDDHGRCVLSYPVPEGEPALTLRLFPTRRAPAGERLVLEPDGDGRALVLTDRGNVERLPLAAGR